MYRTAFLAAVLVCVAPVLLLVASLVHLSLPALHPLCRHASSALLPPAAAHALRVLANSFMLAAFGIWVINFRLSFLNRPAQEGRAAKHVSPIPFVGSFFVTLAGVLGYGSPTLIFGRP
jgi:hypothetical protein